MFWEAEVSWVCSSERKTEVGRSEVGHFFQHLEQGPPQDLLLSGIGGSGVQVSEAFRDPLTGGRQAYWLQNKKGIL